MHKNQVCLTDSPPDEPEICESISIPVRKVSLHGFRTQHALVTFIVYTFSINEYCISKLLNYKKCQQKVTNHKVHGFILGSYAI